MSQENVERFLEGVEAFNRGDVERWLEGFDPGAVLEVRQAELEGGYSRHDGLRRFFAEFAAESQMFEVHYSDVRDLGDRVLGLGTLRIAYRGSGLEIEGPVAILASYRDGLCTHLTDYGEWGQALEAAGLRE